MKFIITNNPPYEKFAFCKTQLGIFITICTHRPRGFVYFFSMMLGFTCSLYLLFSFFFSHFCLRTMKSWVKGIWLLLFNDSMVHLFFIFAIFNWFFFSCFCLRTMKSWVEVPSKPCTILMPSLYFSFFLFLIFLLIISISLYFLPSLLV